MSLETIRKRTRNGYPPSPILQMTYNMSKAFDIKFKWTEASLTIDLVWSNSKNYLGEVLPLAHIQHSTRKLYSKEVLRTEAQKIVEEVLKSEGY